MSNRQPLPARAFVPGGPWPRPEERSQKVPPLADPSGLGLEALRRGIELFDAGFYWEAHEVWETLWHAEGRKGSNADVIKGLIKLAAAGVKVRERQPHGVSTHAARAAILFDQVQKTRGRDWLGLDLSELAEFAQAIAQTPPEDRSLEGAAVSIVFEFRLEKNLSDRVGTGPKHVFDSGAAIDDAGEDE
jgi:uncharacterized protein